MTQRTMPRQKPGHSEQAVGTPREFLDAVLRLLHVNAFACDLAATHDNAVCEPYLTEAVNALTVRWADFDGWCWLNPPYSKIGPWAAKAWQESRHGAKVAMLVPASVGSNWWADSVSGKGYEIILRNRITFIGHDHGYPKDLVLILYAPFLAGGRRYWRWAGKEK